MHSLFQNNKYKRYHINYKFITDRLQTFNVTLTLHLDFNIALGEFQKGKKP